MAESKDVKSLLASAETLDLQLEIDRLGTELRFTKKQNGKLREAIQLERDRLAYLYSLKKYNKTTTIRYKKGIQNEATAVAMLSDIHAEERVDKLKVNRLNEYNPDICWSRCEHFFTNSLKVVESLRSHNTIRNIVLWLGGDLITGSIHDDLVQSNFMHPNEAGQFVKRILRSGLNYWIQNGSFEKIYIKCNYGNHPRMSKKPKIKLRKEDSLEWPIYTDIIDWFDDNEIIDIEIADGSMLYMDIYGYKIRMTHGDQIKYNGGIGGISIPLFKKIASWDRARPADLTLCGHFHQFNDYGKAIINGSVIGYSELALDYGFEPEPPQQTLFLVDAKKQRKSAVFPIWLN